MFRVFPRPSSGAQWLQWQPLVLPSYRGDSRAVFVVGPAGLLFTAQHVSGVFPLIIRSSMTAVAVSSFTFVSWWQSCCVRGRAGRPAWPRTQNNCHHDTNAKPEAATAVIDFGPAGRPDHGHRTTVTTTRKQNQRLPLQSLSYWWWAGKRPKHVEL
jgi:hypothetical protein